MDAILDSLFDSVRTRPDDASASCPSVAALVLPTHTLAQDAARAPAPLVRACPSTTSRSRSAMFHIPSRFTTVVWVRKAGQPRTPDGYPHGLADGYISIDSVADQKGVITHFAVQSTIWIGRRQTPR